MDIFSNKMDFYIGFLYILYIFIFQLSITENNDKVHFSFTRMTNMKKVTENVEKFEHLEIASGL